MNLLKLTALFIASLMKKTYLAVHLTPVSSFFEKLLADRKAVDSTPEYSLLAEDTNQAFVFPLT